MISLKAAPRPAIDSRTAFSGELRSFFIFREKEFSSPREHHFTSFEAEEDELPDEFRVSNSSTNCSMR
jgi:hypothetical protein